jgi:N6-L-threonylcarbamoyladenine synthase
MLILGIESSCDETAAAVVENGKKVLSDVVASQVDIHGPYGGVVPEIASRHHLEMILPVIGQALQQARLKPVDVDAIGVTQGPGLVGALLVGISAAKAMAFALDKPLIGVNHLEGHIQSAFIGGDMPDRPFVCLVVSGGHTALYRVEPDGHSRSLGSTRDDAAGEAFDKVAKILGLGYPGGAVIDKLAMGGNPEAVPFPKGMKGKDSLEFSFSGLKTAVANFVHKNGTPGPDGKIGNYSLEDVLASFQESVVDVLVSKSIRAAVFCGARDIAVVGGVAANRRLRARMAEETARAGLDLHIPPLRYCTDNAVMIAAAAYRVWRRAGFCPDPLDLDAVSRWV